MSDERKESRNIISNVIFDVLFDAVFPCDFDHDVELVFEMYREYFNEYKLVGDCGLIKAAFKRAYFCISKCSDERERDMIVGCCEDHYADAEQLLKEIAEKGWELMVPERNAVRALCRFWQKFNEIEGGAK